MSTTATDLARRNEELEAELAQLRDELAERDAKLEQMFDLLKRLQRDNALLKQELLRLQRARYAPKADRLPDGQLALFAPLTQ